ncbi:MAG TPA: ATP-binding protein, partial [Anaerolineales bacterium]|nr:ATP-binding protein [Anaerolineales bacterium]
GILNLLISPAPALAPAIILRSVAGSCIIGIPLFLLRRGFYHTSVAIIITLLLLLETFAVLSADLRRVSDTLSFFTLAIILSGLLVGRGSLFLTFAISSGVVLFGAFREQDAALKVDGIAVAGNFILLNGLMVLFLDQFGVTLRNALNIALEHETDLNHEINIRRKTEATLQQTNAQLEILHEIDRSLLTANILPEIARNALVQIRQLIPCPRASVTLFDQEKKEASFLSADFDIMVEIPGTPISFEEFGQRVIDKLLENKPWFSEDILQDPEVTDFDKRLVEEAGIQVWLSLPLMAQGQLIGALNLGRPVGKPFTSQDAEIAHDIANQLAVALQQANLYKALEKELAERQKLITQLEANNAELERFTYTVSHDLRNPLVTIKGFRGMLDKDIQEQRRDRIHEDFQRISSAADKMDELLSDLLELSRIGRIINPPEEVLLDNLIRDALENLDARIHTRNVTIEVLPDLPTVYGDRIRLREVFENLIDNAVKYLGNQPHPVIEIGVTVRNGEEIIFVKDNGLGIDAIYQIKIFSLFEKLNPTIEGTGIGLALVKRIIETHGGRIWVESEGSGKGSTFYFTIPDGRHRAE